MKIITCAAIFLSILVTLSRCANVCYYCDHCPDPFVANATGVTQERCSNPLYSCATIERKGASFNATSRECKKECSSETVSEDGVSVTTSCCLTDLCNNASPVLNIINGFVYLPIFTFFISAFIFY